VKTLRALLLAYIAVQQVSEMHRKIHPNSAIERHHVSEHRLRQVCCKAIEPRQLAALQAWINEPELSFR
jgi:hypothetical protein